MKITALLAVFYTLIWAAVGQPVAIPPEATTPQWPKPSTPSLSSNSASVRSKELELVHSSDTFGGFGVRISGRDFAIGQSQPIIGYVINDNLRWFELSTATNTKVKVTAKGGSVCCHWEGTDPDAGRWELEYQFRPGSLPGSIEVQSQVGVDQDRQVAFLPMFMIFPGGGSFGTAKGQGLFAGLEYLENEPSSSEADVVGPASKRQVPDNLKITFPLMAIENDNQFLALVWLAGKTRQPSVANRLQQTATDVMTAVAPQDLYSSGLGHVRYPNAPLVFGHVRESAVRAADIARKSLVRFEPDGSLHYQAA